MSATIQSFPVELLENIFDRVCPWDRQSASLVCRQWCQILRSDRYVRRMTLTVTNENLCSGQTLRRMRRPFRKLNIEDHSESDPERSAFLARVRKLLASKQVRRNLLELRIEACHGSLNEVFGQQMAVVRFPKLAEIVYTPGCRLQPHEDIAPVINVRIPNLTVLKIDVFTNAAVELVRMASHRITSLSVRFSNKVLLLKVLEIESFPVLQHAGLFAVSDGKKDFVKLRALDFMAAHRATLAKLDSLEIRDAINMFGQVYDFIFQAATNLVQLHVSGVDMSPSALASIHDMKKLKRLHLYIYSFLPRVNF